MHAAAGHVPDCFDRIGVARVQRVGGAELARQLEFRGHRVDRDDALGAVKADTLSLTAWQVDMYGFMALAYFIILRRGFETDLKTDTVEFWFMMLIAMILGFITSYPIKLAPNPERR
jgi:hypothetical protein